MFLSLYSRKSGKASLPCVQKLITNRMSRVFCRWLSWRSIYLLFSSGISPTTNVIKPYQLFSGNSYGLCCLSSSSCSAHARQILLHLVHTVGMEFCGDRIRKITVPKPYFLCLYNSLFNTLQNVSHFHFCFVKCHKNFETLRLWSRNVKQYGAVSNILTDEWNITIRSVQFNECSLLMWWTFS